MINDYVSLFSFINLFLFFFALALEYAGVLGPLSDSVINVALVTKYVFRTVDHFIRSYGERGNWQSYLVQ